MKIGEKTVVGLIYELKVSRVSDSGEAPFSVEIRDEEDPFYFLFGNSGLPEKFEELLNQKAPGDNFAFIIKVGDAYGEKDEELIIPIPKSQFSEERGFNSKMLKEGNFLPLVDEEGYPMQAKLIKNLGEELLLDFNHPLVGFNLHFNGKILKVREASEEESVHGQVLDNNGTALS